MTSAEECRWSGLKSLKIKISTFVEEFQWSILKALKIKILTFWHSLQTRKSFSLRLDLTWSTLEEEKMPLHITMPQSIGPLKNFASRGLLDILPSGITCSGVMNFETPPLTKQCWRCLGDCPKLTELWEIILILRWLPHTDHTLTQQSTQLLLCPLG